VFAGSSARAVALFASFVAAHRDPRLSAERGLFEFKGQIFSQIGATLSPAAAACSSAEGIAEAEELAENIS
jgi:hypothetical protein